MIDQATVNRILELHSQGYSGTHIARLVGRNKQTVYRVLNGNVRAHTDEEPLFNTEEKVRCSICGGLVHPPCLRCSTDASKSSH